MEFDLSNCSQDHNKHTYPHKKNAECEIQRQREEKHIEYCLVMFIIENSTSKATYNMLKIGQICNYIACTVHILKVPAGSLDKMRRLWNEGHCVPWKVKEVLNFSSKL